MRRSFPLAIAGLFAIGVLLAACGDDSGSSTATTAGSASAGGLTVKATEYKFEISGSASAGYNKVTFENDGKSPHMLAAIKLKAGKTVADALPILEQQSEPDPAAVAAVFDGDPSTAWYGTPDLISPGVTTTTYPDFPAGNYMFVCFLPGPGGQPHLALGMAAQFTVADTGGSPTPPQTDGTFTITADKITPPEGLKSGTYEVKNTTADPSDFHMAGPTDKQVDDFVKAVNDYFTAMSSSEDVALSTPAPIIAGLSGIPTGQSGYIVLDLKQGRYVFGGATDDSGVTKQQGEATVSS
jgi:plastocyanin